MCTHTFIIIVVENNHTHNVFNIKMVQSQSTHNFINIIVGKIKVHIILLIL